MLNICSIEKVHIPDTDCECVYIGGDNIQIDGSVINAVGLVKEEDYNKESILTMLGYGQVRISMVDDSGSVHTWEVLGKEII